MRTLATLGSFVLLLGLYFLYGWVLVPEVLPPVVENSMVFVAPSEGVAHDESKPYHFLLPEKEWERNPETELHYLKFGETILLFGKDTPNGKIVKLEPCTVLMVSGIDDPDLTEEQIHDRLRQATVLRTPLYAEIEFDKEFNLSQIAQLNIVGGRLFGKVTVESDMKIPGPSDDIYLETEDIQISLVNPTQVEISTIKDVRFRFGYHTGEGSMLKLELASVNPKNPKSEKQLKQLQFEQLKQLSLVFPEDSEAAPKVVADAAGIRGQRILPNCPASFLNIKCRRQFNFLAQQPAGSWLARFLGNVEIARTTPDGFTDWLNAEEVRVDFQEKKTPKAQTAVAKASPKSNSTTAKMGDLEPIRFEAHGRLAQGNQPNVPARLISKRNGGVLMNGDQILYDLQKNVLALETQTLPGASPEVEIIFENRYHIRGQKGFEYTMGEKNQFGRLVSIGKGSLTGALGEEGKTRNLFLSWNQMQIVPDPEKKDQIVLKLWNGVAANLEGFGKMTAGRLDLWCQSTPKVRAQPAAAPPASGSQAALPGLGGNDGAFALAEKSNFRPIDAVVSDKVRFENDNGVCNVNRLDVIFADSEALRLSQASKISDYGTPKLHWAGTPGNHTGTNRTVWIDGFVQQKRNVRLVQHVQNKNEQRDVLVATAPASPQIPLYEAPANPPVASKAPARAVNAAPAPTRNLLGLQSGGSPAKYEITGNAMQMKVDENAQGGSRVDALKIEGDVRIIETVLDRTQGDVIEVYGEEIRVWNPSTEAMQIQIVGNPRRDAEFRGRGVRMVAKEINVSRTENKIWSNGMGRLIVTSEKTGGVWAAKGTPAVPAAASADLMAVTPLTPLASNNRHGNSPLAVEWNESMIFDGKTILFGDHKKNKSRVQTVFQDKNIWCNVMEIHLNRLVNFFEKEDPGLVSPEADTVRCLRDVHVLVREKDENGQLKSINIGRFDTLIYQVKMNYFSATAHVLGELRRTYLSGDKGFGSNAKLPGALASAAKPNPNTAGDTMNFLAVWFKQDIRGTILPDRLDVEINGQVQTAYCPVESWDDVIGIDNIRAACRLGYILECEKLRLLQMPDPLNPTQGAVELRAQENAVIEGNQIYGHAREIKFNQSRNLVIFEGNAKIHTYDDGKRVGLSADAFEYNIETGAHKVRKSSGAIIGQ